MVDDVVGDARRRLGRVGVWLMKARYGVAPIEVTRRELARIEALGYGSVWAGETIGGREAFAEYGSYLAATERIVVGTGIANVWARPGVTMQAGGATLAEAYPGRFVLGIGVGHPFQAELAGATDWRPLSTMRRYLDEMDAGVPARPGAATVPTVPFPRVLAALGPKMLELARDRADGAHPFNTPVEHTAFAREILGADKLLIPQLSVLLETDPAVARAKLREGVAQGVQVKAYADNFRRLGYSEDEIAGRGDRLLDATRAWGDEEAIARRVGEHLDAGADHVLVTPVADDLVSAVDVLERLAAVVGQAWGTAR
ncbi:TIGR03620 family F420-dependent LLM class oxidoreductase [Actinomadura barringtoniae]|uniref:TIGR03620 family F420-dependent LLM class oxidoreductase n=1 Tax=Actinomadura barringtoniae TaxID=1427535 RepID=A0A939PH31_9ACTN|nr:TIGR03620 family F420-dependent LLM class oxidoreductase [Actinomadura barringtoniae]MBO2449639.1 TIGR03620 family F420-dependent LLM class oxidoreductase [Actinomadura barringtoniae]